MSAFLNREQAQAEEAANQTAQKIHEENEQLKLRVEILEGMLEQYAIRVAQMEVNLLIASARAEKGTNGNQPD
jgi:hypothetical protein